MRRICSKLCVCACVCVHTYLCTYVYYRVAFCVFWVDCPRERGHSLEDAMEGGEARMVYTKSITAELTGTPRP